MISTGDRVLVALSGGRDSIALLDVMCKSGYNVGIAHCNFQLRADESEGDTAFVKALAEEYKLPVFIKYFDTQAIANQKNISIQMAARDLRYSWFEELCKEESYDLIATAHHQDDHIETVLINLLRGTGISGMHGILARRDNIIRPLLFASRELINQYIAENNLKYREDSTNTAVKYLRNKLRHEVIPHLKEINANLGKTFSDNSQRFLSAERIYKQKVEEVRKDVCSEENDFFKINISALTALDNWNDYLYELIHPFGFSSSQAENIYSNLTGISGKIFYTDAYELLIDRKDILVKSIVDMESSCFVIDDNCREIKVPIKLNFEKQPFDDNFVISTDSRMAMVDADKIKYPLTLRKWQKGDFFFPLGMKKKKLLSDFFIDQKIPVFVKQKTWILESQGEIVWIVGHRIDNRFKLSNQTREVLRIETEN
ncbi:MAG: tRNA lysidine(34) synthetase TilS [Bacteroidales bacterium]|nr:tRNA lysidine(34) synthetase TilS [Bacteroidales bacterium]